MMTFTADPSRALGFLLTSAFVTLFFSASVGGVCAQDASHAVNWSGLYLGLSVGGVRDDSAFLSATSALGFPDLPQGESVQIEASGLLMRGGVGYDASYGPASVGVFGEFAVSNAEGQTFSRYGYADDDTSLCGGYPCRNFDDDLFTLTNPYLATLGARGGVALDKLFFYVAAAGSYGLVRLSVVDDNHDSGGLLNFNSTGQGSDEKWLIGYTLKVGAEFALGPHSAVGLSYSNVVLGPDRYKLAGPSTCYGCDVPNYEDVNYLVDSSNFRSQIVAVDVTYHF